MTKIIIVDDEKASLNSMGRVITSIRKDVEVIGLFSSVQLAKEFLAENDTDIILSDIKMPGEDGIALARFVSENYPEIKIVFFSAYNDFEYAQQAINLNVKHYLSKPINIEELNSTLDNLIRLIEKENKNREENKIKDRKYSDLLRIAKADLYFEIMAGYLFEKSKISLRLKNLEMEESLVEACYGVISVKNEDSEIFGGENAFSDMLEKNEYIKDCIPVIRLAEEKVFAVRFDEKISLESAAMILEKELDVNFEVLLLSDSVYDLCEYKNIIENKKPSDAEGENVKKASDTIDLIKKFVKENYMNDIILEDIAKHVNLSNYYISKLFKTKTGQGISDYITSVRINAAIELMKTQKYKVYEISEMCGYKSRKYFTHSFKQHTGYTPSEYQRMI